MFVFSSKRHGRENVEMILESSISHKVGETNGSGLVGLAGLTLFFASTSGGSGAFIFFKLASQSSGSGEERPCEVDCCSA